LKIQIVLIEFSVRVPWGRAQVNVFTNDWFYQSSSTLRRSPSYFRACWLL